MKLLHLMRIGLSILSIFILATAAFSQREDSNEGEAVIHSPFPVSLGLKKAKRDNRGTDVRLIKDITVDFDGEAYRTANGYNVLFYLDGLPTAEFRHKTLPFTFSWNFKGLKDGAYRIRIEIEDPQSLSVLAVREDTVEVVR